MQLPITRLLCLLPLLLLMPHVASAQSVTPLCPATGIQMRPAEFTPGGIILTTFDGQSMWVYDIDRDTRYPLPETAPCGSNCHLSPDARWISFLNADTFAYGKMRLDGTERTALAEDASEVRWWNPDILLVWTPDQRAYLRMENDPAQREELPAQGLVSVQPGGRWGVLMTQTDETFSHSLVNLETRGTADETQVLLAPDVPYFNSMGWSPTGDQLAFVGRGAHDENAGVAGGEIFTIRPGDAIPRQMTFLTAAYGAARINGRSDQLSWSPDGSTLAFWVIELLGPELEGDLGTAVIHTLNVSTGEVTAYCGFATNEHTPHTPRLIWSPDGSTLAFGGNVEGDNRGYLLLALNLETGLYTELSEGIFPSFGAPDLIAWGDRP